MNTGKNNKDLVEIYKKTIHSIEKEAKRISFLNKFRLKKTSHCKQEVTNCYEKTIKTYKNI